MRPKTIRKERAVNKQPEVTAATRRRIIDAFWLLYAQAPIEQIRIKEVAAAAGINRATFYRYFGSIYEILEQEERRIVDEVLQARKSMGGKATSGAANLPLDASPNAARLPLDAVMQAIARVYERNGAQICLLTGTGGDPAFIERFKAALLPDFEERLGTPDSPATRIAFDYGLTGLIAAFRTWHESDPRPPLADFLALARALTLHGVPAALQASTF